MTPLPPGKLSLTLNPVAVPAPPLLSTTVNPICEPALTLPASAVWLIEVVAHRITSEAEAVAEELLSVVKLAILLYVSQLFSEVLLTTCAWTVVLPARIVGL